MSPSTTSPRRRRAAVSLFCSALLLTALTGCSTASEPAAVPTRQAARSAPTASAAPSSPRRAPATPSTSPQAPKGHRMRLPVPPDVVAGLRTALRARADAVRRADGTAFTAGLAPSRPSFLSHQQTYFDNLRQLPLADFGYGFDRRDLVRQGDDYWLVVDVTTQLQGYDAVPVVRADRYRFNPAGGGRFRLASVSDPTWERTHQVEAEPWERGPIVVRQAPDVLGIFDERSVRRAQPLVRTTSASLADVASAVPYDWTPSVVLLAFSDPRYLSSLPDLPGGDPSRLDGLAFPVPDEVGGSVVASTRVALSPRTLTRGAATRARLVRHELTHVALGSRDDQAPLWLAEGLAEYVSARPLPRPQRRLPAVALQAARAGFHDLPADAAFNDADAAVHYGLSWWACEYLARTQGEQLLWSLLDGYADPGAGPAADPAQVLVGLTGLNSRQLARKAGKLMLATYDRAVTTGRPGTSRRR